MVARMRAAGAIVVGKTNTPESGLGTLTFNDLFGPTRNPWDIARHAGGSSGGAAAAVAAGLLPIADGSDSGGSLRYPASFCNVVGLRPSAGRVPSSRAGDAWSPHGILGPMARTCADAGLLLAGMAGPHPDAPLSLPDDPATFAGVEPTGLRGLRVAWSETVGGLPIDPGVTEALRGTRVLLEEHGCVVEDVEPDIEGADECWEVIELLGFLMYSGAEVDEHPELLRDDLVRNVREARELTPDRIVAAQSQAQRAVPAHRAAPRAPRRPRDARHPGHGAAGRGAVGARGGGGSRWSATSTGSGWRAASPRRAIPSSRSRARSPPTGCRSACSSSAATATSWACCGSARRSRPRPGWPIVIRRSRCQAVAMSDDEEDTVLWSMTCNSCDNEWMQVTPADSDPAAEEIECPACASTMLDAEYAGRR